MRVVDAAPPAAGEAPAGGRGRRRRARAAHEVLFQFVGQTHSVRVAHPHGVGVRTAPALPGERTGDDAALGERLLCIEASTLAAGSQTPPEGVEAPFPTRDVTFYRLADGRGWVHDYDPSAPDVPAVIADDDDDGEDFAP